VCGGGSVESPGLRIVVVAGFGGRRSKHLPSAFVAEVPIPIHTPPWAGPVPPPSWPTVGARSWTLTPGAGLPRDESRTGNGVVRPPGVNGQALRIPYIRKGGGAQYRDR